MVNSLASFCTMCIDTLQGIGVGRRNVTDVWENFLDVKKEKAHFNLMKYYGVGVQKNKKYLLELPNIWKNKESCP